MARRSIERRVLDLLLSSVGTALIALALIIALIREYPLQIIALVIVAVWGRQYWKHRQHGRRVAELKQATAYTEQQIESHRSGLIAYYRQSVRRDQFGNEDARLWKTWIETFIKNQIRPGLETSRVRVGDDLLAHLASHVDHRVRDIAALGQSAELDASNLKPEEYERHCASILFRCGWTVHPTPVTGDHGADVIAEKGQTRLVVQCKFYSQSVGNKAVQEAYSACRLYNGTHACVVAPRGFTAQAQRAAHGLSVRLIHHDQLQTLADELESAAAPTSKRMIG